MNCLSNKSTIPKDKFNHIKNKWGAYASWTMWQDVKPWEAPKAHMGDLSIFDDEDTLLDIVHTDIVFVALNAADRDVADRPFSMFHDTSPRANDYKMRYAFKDTVLWGSYITDLFHNLRETDSNKVSRHLAVNPDFLKTQLDRFKQELADIAEPGYPKPILVALGGTVKGLLDIHLRPAGYNVLSIDHYSLTGTKTRSNNKEEYRFKALELIDQINEIRSISQ